MKQTRILVARLYIAGVGYSALQGKDGLAECLSSVLFLNGMTVLLVMPNLVHISIMYLGPVMCNSVVPLGVLCNTLL
jgi:hypothetical protein